MAIRAEETEKQKSQWSRAIQERITSRQSIKDFCESKGISKNTYYYWYRKVHETEMSQSSQISETSQCPVPGGWSQVCTVPSEVEQHLTIEIGGFRVSWCQYAELRRKARVSMLWTHGYEEINKRTFSYSRGELWTKSI